MPGETRDSFKFEITGNLATGVQDRWTADFNGEITDVKAVVGTAPTGATAILDIQKNGTTVYRTSPDTRPTIAIGATGLNTPAAWANNTSYVVGQRVTVSAAQVGESLPQSEGAGTPGVYECLVAHTSPASGNFVTGPSGGYGSGAAPTGISATPLWQELPGANAPEPASAKFVAGDVLTLNVIQVGSTVAGAALDMNVEYVAE